MKKKTPIRKNKTARTTKTARTAKTKKTEIDMMIPEEQIVPDLAPVNPPAHAKPLISPLQIGGIVVLAVALLVILAAKNGLLMAAFVNGQPIFRWDLDNVLIRRYGQQTLDGMVTEKLIADEAQKANVSVSQTDIDKKGKDILSSFGSNLTIDDFLKLQGMQRGDFDNQIKLQLEVQRLLTKDLSITDTDIDGYIATNRATLIASDPAKLRDEAKQAIIDQKVAEKFDSWLQTIRQKASIQKFL